ncbi:MAG: septum formation initiator family protein [Deltaproteobacteria bacterium]|nr:septum formation initiator family protein [Deltaproteobacteria bacterium]MCL4874816.1 septum formation initiator family protein [bacterium]
MKKTTEGLKKKRLILLVAVLFFGVVAIFGEKGLIELYRVNKELSGILAYNKSLEKENREIEEKIRLLESDRRYIGQIAREELGKLGRNEVIYRIEEPAAGGTRP